MSNKKACLEYRARQKLKGYSYISVKVPTEKKDQFRTLAAKLCAEKQESNNGR